MAAAMPLVRSDELVCMIEECLQHGLYDNATWCSELLCGLSPAAAATPSFAGVGPFRTGCADADAEQALSLLELGEYARALQCLKSTQHRPGPDAQRRIFIGAWIVWRQGEEQRRELCLDKQSLLGGKPPANPKSNLVAAVLSRAHTSASGLCPYGEWLYALLLVDRGMKEEAVRLLISAALKRPLLWEAWKLLADVTEPAAILPVVYEAFQPHGGHWMLHIFEAHILQRTYRTEAAVSRYVMLRGVYPRAVNVLAGLSAAAYDAEDVALSKSVFEEMLHIDPHRIQDMDRYSTLLYTSCNNDGLANLAHRLFDLNPYAAETMCVLGNLYSMQTCSEKAITYFQKAVQINPDFATAWTLLGHEYSPYQRGVNTRACIFSYQRAVHIDKRDYRAWLGLAQIYFSEYGPPNMAPDYYAQKCMKLRPNDPRMQHIAQMIRTEALQRTDTWSVGTPESGFSPELGSMMDSHRH
eukprot:TRINITY_DN6052_c1_g1_i2.p1 TRINITY_DN6052_c1_g1~~TRINITY_DN6052_c1_g1_i2.p1  ORF type:complete len:469 (+),score=85.78 TRINITY_DN6052_c1_g1_i2:64-1470(+)